MEIRTTWNDVKNRAISHILKIQHTETEGSKNTEYYIWVSEEGIIYSCNINRMDNSADVIDFETNHKSNSNKQIKPKTNRGEPIIVEGLRDGSRVNFVSHDFTNKTTWWQGSIKVLGETLTNSGDNRTYNYPHQFIINANAISDRDKINDWQLLEIRQKIGMRYYFDRVYINNILQNPNTYLINYITGKITFNISLNPTDIVTADYYYANSSTYRVTPLPGKILRIYRIEIQFSKNSMINHPLEYRVKIGPNVVYSKVYNFPVDFLNESNIGYEIPAFGGLLNNVIVLPWDYPTSIDLRSSLGMSVEIQVEDDVPYNGDIGTATIYCLVENE